MRPLEDVRVLAIEQYGAGPYGTVHLADLGADIIKIEDPRTGGDIGRQIPPYRSGEDNLFFEGLNRNKRSLSLDIDNHAGRQVFEDLVRVADGVYSNLRGDVPERLRIRYADLSHLNPRIVCASLSGYGMTGPRRAEPGYDFMIQGLAGWMSLTGEPDSPPAKTGLSLVDWSGGLTAALSLVVGIHAARRDGVGMDCDVALFDTAVSLLTYPATWHLTAGFEPKRVARSAHPSVVPFQNFPTQDGWIVCGGPKEKFWLRLVEALGRPELASDERFHDGDARSRNAAELVAILDEVFRTDTTASWVSRLQQAGVPCQPVNTVAAALKDEQVEARGMVIETTHPHFGRVRQTASPVNVGDQPIEHRRAPRPNEDAHAVLTELLAYSPERVTELRAAGAFGDP